MQKNVDVVTLHDALPIHLAARVFEKLDTKERAQLAVVCKAWQAILAESWNTIRLTFTTLKQLDTQRQWLDRVAVRGSGYVRLVEMQWQGGVLLHSAAGSLHVEHFRNLEKLHLKRPNSAYWAINSKAIRSLAALTFLKEMVLVFSPSMSKGHPVVSLEEFAAFPQLELLSIMLQPSRGWEAGWRCELSPALQGLHKLQHLTIGGAESVTVNPALCRVVGRLATLDLEVRTPIAEVVEAPHVQWLRYKSIHAQHLPFQGFRRLQTLTYQGNELQTPFLGLNPWLRELTLGYSLQGVDAAFVRQLLPLEDLRVLKIRFYNTLQGREDLAAFTTLTRLERLEVDMLPQGPLLISPAESLSCMMSLKELRLSSLVSLPLTLAGGLERLPALESLHAEMRESGGPLASPTLQQLSLEGLCGFTLHSYPSLGSLPRLRRLHIKLVPNLADCPVFARQLAQLPLLTELFVTKGYTQGGGELPSPQPEGTATFERFLHSLKRLKGLRVLRVAAINDDVSLSRTILPPVQQLGLACRGLAVCSSCLPWGPRSLNLVFTAASNTTHERLDLTTDLTSTFEPNIQTTVWSARLSHGGVPPCEFEEDLFDDHVDGSGSSESSSNE